MKVLQIYVGNMENMKGQFILPSGLVKKAEKFEFKDT